MIGFPRILQSDNGTEFVNSLVKTMSNNLGVNHRLLTPYHPRVAMVLLNVMLKVQWIF